MWVERGRNLQFKKYMCFKINSKLTVGKIGAHVHRGNPTMSDPALDLVPVHDSSANYNCIDIRVYLPFNSTWNLLPTRHVLDISVHHNTNCKFFAPQV